MGQSLPKIAAIEKPPRLCGAPPADAPPPAPAPVTAFALRHGEKVGVTLDHAAPAPSEKALVERCVLAMIVAASFALPLARYWTSGAPW
ncbi:MAG: hypothetical protein KGK11_01240 [Sphingomonadales bacterium]|nr:hypothetical protein [Sphingomonadales bacterium]